MQMFTLTENVCYNIVTQKRHNNNLCRSLVHFLHTVKEVIMYV